MTMAENTTPTAEELARQAAELREQGAALTLKARQEAAERRAELQRLDAEENAKLAQLEAEYGAVIAQREREAHILHATEILSAATKAADEVNTAALSAREGLADDMQALVKRFLEWRAQENEYAAAEDARLQAAEGLARVDGSAVAPVPTAWSQGQPIYSSATRQPVQPRDAQFTDWNDPLVWLAWAAKASEPTKNDLSLGFTVRSR